MSKKVKIESKKGNKKFGLIIIILSSLMIFSSLLFKVIFNPFYLIQLATTLLVFGTGLNIVFWIFIIAISCWRYFDIKTISSKRFVALFILLTSVSFFITVIALMFKDTTIGHYLSISEIYKIMFISPLKDDYHGLKSLKFVAPNLVYGGVILPFLIWILGGVIFTPIVLLISFTIFLYSIYVMFNDDYEIFFQKLNPISKEDEEVKTEKQGDTIDLNQPTKEFQFNLNKEEQQRKEIIEKIRINSDKKNYNELSKKIEIEREKMTSLREQVLSRVAKTKENNRKNSTISDERRDEILSSLGVVNYTYKPKKVDKNKNDKIKYSFVENNNKPSSFSNEYSIELTNEIILKNTTDKKISNEISSIQNYYDEIYNDKNLEKNIAKTIEQELTIKKEQPKSVIIDNVVNEITVEEYFDLPNQIDDMISKNNNVEPSIPTNIPKPKTVEKKIKIEKPKEVIKEEIIDEGRPNNWCSPYTLPSTSILSSSNGEFNNAKLIEEVTNKSKRLSEVLVSFGIKATIHSFEIGPTVSTFKIQLDSGIKTSKVTNLEDNMKLTLGAEYIRIIAPIPGTSFIGIEVPNSVKKPVKFKNVFNETKPESGDGIQISIGQDVSGNPLSFDLTKAPHLLVAGSTGSGKSVAINTILASILLRYKPTDVQLVLVDPKMVEFTPFHDIPHLITKVVTDPSNANIALKSMVDEMEDRYKEMAEKGAKKIEELNEKLIKNGEPKKPYIVVIIDELADLMMTTAKEVEDSIMRITQKARAAGIHMVLATQRPSTEIITGTIKSNIPSRMAFTVASSIDSRTILGQIGAEKLIGMGDMLVSLYGKLPFRGQGAYISNDEIDAITAFAKNQCSPFYSIDLSKIKNENSLSGNLLSTDDPMYKASKEIVIRQRKASTSMLQRHLNIGYNRAATIIDTLESEEIIGPARGSKPREVLVAEED